jgi:hypothetical protein
MCRNLTISTVHQHVFKEVVRIAKTVEKGEQLKRNDVKNDCRKNAQAGIHDKQPELRRL